MGHLKTQKSERERMWKWILPVSLVLICFAIMTPRLLSPQFGLLDDGVTLKIEREISEGSWDIGWETGGGRLRPGYLFYWSLIQMATGRNPFWFFFSNAIVLTAIAILLFVLVQMLGGSRLQGWAAGMFFVLSGPVVETFYTLSKVEHIQVLGILLSLLAVLCAFRQPRRWLKIILFLGAAILLIWVYLSKEIALIMVPISLAWVFVAWIFNKRVYGLQPIKMWISFFATNLLAAAVFLAFYVIYIGQSVAAQGYSQKYILDWKIIANSSIRWVGWFIYDFPFLIPLFLCLVILAILKKKLAQPVLILNVFIWMAGWILIFLPWSVIAEYYILPFSIGASIVSGIALGQIYDFLNTKTSKGRIFVISLLVLALPLFLVTLINHAMNIRVQLTVDKNNALMIDKVATIAPQNSLVLVNLNDDNEYIDEIRLHLTELYHRSDLTVDSFHFQSAIAGEADMLSYIVLMSSVENKMLLSVRIGIAQEKLPEWNNALRGYMGGDETPAWSTEGHFRLFHIDFLQLLCPILQSRTYCASNSPFIDRRLFSYGWDLYQVSSDVDDLDLPAVFKPDAEWEFQMPDGSIHHINFGQPGDYPLVGDWNGDGISDIGVFRPDTLIWYLDEDFDGQSDFEFQLTGMQATDMPLAGDWDGDGVDTAGYFHPQDSSWHLRNSNSSGAEDLSVLEAGSPGDVPLVGDWVGDGRDTIGVYRPEVGEVDLEDEFVPGLSGADFRTPRNAIPVSADWAGRGFDSLAFFDNGEWHRLFVNCNCPPSNQAWSFSFGATGDIPLAGKWRITK